jgi:hypothetical protein
MSTATEAVIPENLAPAAPGWAPTQVLDLSPKKIHVPKGKRQRFKESDELQSFLDSVRRVGLLHPIDVRKIGENDYELVFGAKRLWAAKQLGLATIPAKVSSWTDEQVNWVALAENTQRGHLPPAQYAKQMQALMREFERCFGADLGKAAGGLARAQTAERDPETQQFVEKLPYEPANGKSQEPATDSASVAGSEAPPTPLGHTTMLAEATGMAERNTRDYVNIARNFTEDELTALEGASKEELIQLTKLPDDERHAAVNLIAAGSSIQAAIETIHHAKADPKNQEAAKQLKEAELSDEVWLATTCQDCRTKLQDPTCFDREALLYRRDRTERSCHKARSKQDVLSTRAKGWGPLSQLLANLFWVEHPNDWYVCGECQGQNKDHPECLDCKGTGFRLKIVIPKK